MIYVCSEQKNLTVLVLSVPFTVIAPMLVCMWNHWIHTLMMCQAKFGSNWPSISRGDFQINFCYNRSNLHIVQNTM
jgi:hypothetical protein